MSAFRWILITVGIVLGLLIVAIAVGGLWLNSFIHSEAFKAEVEARAGQSLGGTVQIQTVNFDIFNGVKLQGVVTQIDASTIGGQGALQASIAGVDCTYAWQELFNRRLKLTGVTLDKPQIVLTKQVTAPLAPSPSAPVTASTPSGPVTSEGTGTSEATGSSAEFQFVLDHAKINDGSVSVRDASGTSMLELQGVNIASDTAGYYAGKDVTGTVKIASMTLPPNYQVTSFSTPFTYHTGGFSASGFSATAFGGNVAGDYNLSGGGPSILNLNAKGIDVSQLTAATPSTSTATLTGSLDLQSKWRSIESGTVDGEGDTQFANGKLTGVKIFQELGGLLKIKELNDPIIINKAVTHFQVQNAQTQLTGLQVDTTIFQITGGGTVGFDGGLNLSLVLILSKDAMGRMPQEVAASFVTQQDGTGSIAFKVSGTTSNPQTDLPTRLLLQNTQIKNVIDKALNKFFH